MEGPEVQRTEAQALEALARERFVAGDPGGAIELLRKAISVAPGAGHLYANLGVALASLGRIDEAIPILETALAHQPGRTHIAVNLARAYVGRASSFMSGGRFAEAIPDYQSALVLWPGHDWALNNLAVALQELGRAEEALGVCREAVGRHPDFVEARYNLGRIFQDLNRQDEAGQAFEQALTLRPQYAQARNNLAMTLQARGRFDEAVDEFRRAIASDCAYDDPRINLGIALRDAGRIDEAVGHYRKLLAARPDFAEARWNLGTMLLLRGDLEEGFAAAEARRGIPRLECDRAFAQPQWGGEELGGRTILLHAEQGFGDAIQFVRYAPLVRERGGRVILFCQPGLKRLFEDRLGIERVYSEGEALGAFDVHCPLLTLPLVFRTGLATIPADVPYLTAERSQVERWAQRLGSIDEKRKVGLAWAGNPGHVNDRQRSIGAELLEPLGRIAGVRFISLQKSRPSKSAVPAGLELVDFTNELSDFADTAAVVANLDLIITVDTAVAHLAGAMGKAVWVLLPRMPDWRWMLDRDDSPWYPTMRLFRQERFGDWESVLAKVAASLL